MSAPSIRRRILLISTLLVSGFIGAAGWSLNSAFRERSETALVERLQAHIYTLLATATEDEQGRLRMPKGTTDPLFNQPDSGTYALVTGEQGRYIWRSESLLGRQLPLPQPLPTGNTRRSTSGDLVILDQAIAWDDLGGTPIPYTLRVAVDTSNLRVQQQGFQRTLWLWLGALGALLLMVQLLAMRWGLAPLKRIAHDIRKIEQGHSSTLPKDTPVEIKPLADAINSLISQAQTRQARVRHSLADLAHSLKTPLTILRGTAHGIKDSGQAQLINEQVSRIDEIISYQRQRAAVSGANTLLPPVPVRPVAERLGRGLHKLAVDHSIDFQITVPDTFTLKIDSGDLMELLGNLLENAFRHAHSKVHITAENLDLPTLVIEDDGEGIPQGLSSTLFERGIRGDQVHPGEGIGLAVVSQILAQYAASIRVEASSMGGARFVLAFPA